MIQGPPSWTEALEHVEDDRYICAGAAAAAAEVFSGGHDCVSSGRDVRRHR